VWMTIIVILICLGLLGLVASYTLGGLSQLLLILAVIISCRQSAAVIADHRPAETEL
jgi:hypothetical protein